MLKSLNLILLFVVVSYGLELPLPPLHTKRDLINHHITARSPTCQGENEVYTCRPRDEACDYSYRKQHHPNPINACKTGCYCKIGYVRSGYGALSKCEPRSQFCNVLKNDTEDREIKNKREIKTDIEDGEIKNKGGFNTDTEDLEVLLDTPIGITYQKGHVNAKSLSCCV